MPEQAPQVSLGKKIAFTVGSLIVAALYFTWLDWALMNMQGLDYFYMFRK
jgi:flagellar biogenesis protein FliO